MHSLLVYIQCARSFGLKDAKRLIATTKICIKLVRGCQTKKLFRIQFIEIYTMSAIGRIHHINVCVAT